jgi:hypothetical protein
MSFVNVKESDPIDAWFMQRHSRFTASMAYKLLIPSKDGSLFSAGAMTYIREKAVETLTVLQERPQLEFVESLIHGKAQEYNAFMAYVNATGNHDMRYFGTENPLYLSINEYSGGSPDGLMGEETRIDLGLELKSPYNSANHFKYLQFKSQWDLKEQRIEYYTQIQMLMMAMNTDTFHFGSFDDRFKKKEHQLKILEVKKDQKFQDNLEMKLHLAQKEKLKIINALG